MRAFFLFLSAIFSLLSSVALADGEVVYPSSDNQTTRESYTTFEDMVGVLDEYSLPQVNLEVDIAAVGRWGGYTDGKVTIVEYNPQSQTADRHTFGCKLRYRGSSAMRYDKKPFNMKLVDSEGEKMDTTLLGLRNDNSWILDAMAIDPLRMRNRVLFDIWNDISRTPYKTDFDRRNGTEGRFVELWINGDYHGLYCLSDKIDRKLLDLKKVKEPKKEGDAVTVRGVLYKGNGVDSLTAGTLKTYQIANTDKTEWNSWELQYPDDYPSEQAWEPLMNLIDACGNVEREEFEEVYLSWFYLENLVDYWVFLQAFYITDMPYKNTFLSTPNIQDSHRFMLTPWDLDASLGRTWNGSELNKRAALGRMDKICPFDMLRRYKIDRFNYLIAKRWHEWSENELHPDRVKERISAYADRFVRSGAWNRDARKWDKGMQRQERISQDADMTKLLMTEIRYVNAWYKANWEFLNEQLRYVEDFSPFDINSDHAINVSDVNILVSLILSGKTEGRYGYDLSGDGKVNVTDVNILVSKLLTLE